ncbi:MAG: PH domain-containing protein [Haloferacaceae archaeon]
MKLSPLSVPYRVVRRGASLAFTLLFLVVTGSSMVGGTVGAVAGVALVGLAVVLLVGYEVAYWQRYEYELTDDTFDIRSGVVARRERKIPLRRIQNVDIRRNVVQRILGIAALDLETAGGGDTEAAVRYVSFEEAKRLQRAIAERKRGETAEEETEAPAGEVLFELSPRELALVGALSFDLRLPGLVLFLFSGSATALPTVFGVSLSDAGTLALAGLAAVGLLVVLVVSWAVGATVAVLNYYGFRLTRVDDELQYERGLLRRYDGSVPLSKVQALTVEDNPLKRRFGYASLSIETAGRVGGREGGSGSQAAVPIARVDRVYALARDVEAFGEPDVERPPGRVRRRYAARYLLATGALVGLLYGVETALVSGLPVPWYAPVALLPVLALAAHLKWVHRGYWLGDDHLVTRNGVLSRETKVVPYYRVQTVIDSRTVFQRRWGLGTVTADTAGSLSITGSDAAAVDVDDGTADRLREELAERLRRALAERGRERGWEWGDVEPAEGGDAAADATTVGTDDVRTGDAPASSGPSDDARTGDDPASSGPPDDA